LLRPHIQGNAGRLLDRALPNGEMDVIADFSAPLPAVVTAELMGLPAAAAEQPKS
jgi:pimeloyl-[acyl-carrier protein] synthase